MILDSRKIYGRFIGQPISAQELFGSLPLETTKRLTFIQQRKKIDEGEIISKSGIFPENIYVLIEGQAQMTLKNNLSRKNISRLLEREEIIGLTQFISGSPNEMNVVALSSCFLDVFSTEDFLNFLKDEPQVCFRLFNQLSLDIHTSYKTFSSMFF